MFMPNILAISPMANVVPPLSPATPSADPSADPLAAPPAVAFPVSFAAPMLRSFLSPVVQRCARRYLAMPGDVELCRAISGDI